MVVKCEIKFDNNPNGIYFAGQVNSYHQGCKAPYKVLNRISFSLQTLSGIVELTTDKPKVIRGKWNK